MQLPNRTKVEILSGSIDLANDDIRVALYDDGVAFSFDPDIHDFVGDVLDGGTTAQEPSDSSYGRQSLSGQSTSADDTDDEGVFDADDVTFPSLSTTNQIQGVLIYKQITDDTDSPIVGVIDDVDDSDLPAETNGTDFIIEWSANGVITASEP
jgi:hypothetical protein